LRGAETIRPPFSFPELPLDPDTSPFVPLSATERALELDAALRVVATEASTDLGAMRIRGLRPAAAPEELDARRRAGQELSRLLVDGAIVASAGESFLDVVAALRGDAGLAGRELLRVAALLRAVETARGRVLAAQPPTPAWLTRFTDLPDGTALVRRIDAILDRRGEVREDASPALIGLRRSIRAHRERLYGELKEHVARLGDSLSEDTIPMRNNRLVLVLDAGARGRVPGLVHGRSTSGKSFYFEPLETVETNNQLQQSLEDESEERRRVLAELAALVVAHAELVEAHADVLAELDLFQAAARFARSSEGRWAEIPRQPELRLVAARHPLLDPRLTTARREALGAAGHEGEAVPLDVRLDLDRRILVLTGPNAGGKTVALKTIGLLSLLHHCGLPIPCGAGSALSWCDRFVATVGDDQDLLHDRSTFSGRLLRLREAWEAAGEHALVLLDELGSGTDPEEGAALSIALLEHLVGERVLGIITTHLTRVAGAAIDLEGAACGAMEFSPDSGRPTFRLLLGPPGGSEAIALARRLGLSPAWIGRAEELLGSEQRDYRRLLAEVESARDEFSRSRERLEVEASDLAKIRERLDRERSALEAERKVTASRAKRELDEFRQETARRLATEVERLRQEFEAGRRQRLAAEATERLFAAAPAVDTENAAPVESLGAGVAVRHRVLGWVGTIERVQGDRVDVRVGGKRVRARIGELAAAGAGDARRSGAASEPKGRAPRRGAVDEAGAPDTPAELQLIGVRVEDAIGAVDAFLDQALRGSRREVRLVHGHGTGRLRDALRQALRRHPAVAALRPGEPREGGNGATIVTLRET
jgi:DNA mismatch repair protein MutS2